MIGFDHENGKNITNINKKLLAIGKLLFFLRKNFQIANRDQV